MDTSRPMAQGYHDLTEKEKETLRLIVRGHDAKSTARELGLSVHTINERLRAARRKLTVTSSREAARLLLECEGIPESFGDSDLGDAGAAVPGADRSAPETDPPATRRGRRILAGGVLMSLVLAALALAAQSTGPAQNASASPAPPVQIEGADAARAAAAWLALVDKGDWEESWKQTGSAFRSLNTVEVWADASEQARAPLGALVSRKLVSSEYVPAPPRGYRMLKFATSYANKTDATETVSLTKEDGVWKVVGVTID